METLSDSLHFYLLHVINPLESHHLCPPMLMQMGATNLLTIYLVMAPHAGFQMDSGLQNFTWQRFSPVYEVFFLGCLSLGGSWHCLGMKYLNFSLNYWNLWKWSFWRNGDIILCLTMRELSNQRIRSNSWAEIPVRLFINNWWSSSFAWIHDSYIVYSTEILMLMSTMFMWH